MFIDTESATDTMAPESRLNGRRGSRREVELNVLLYRYGMVVAAGTIKNISSGGLFLETHYRPTNGVSYVEVAFITENGVVTSEYRVQASFVHTTEHGLGLKIFEVAAERRLSA